MCVSDLISVLQHGGSQEGPQDVTYRSAGTPQAEHEATSEKKKVLLVEEEIKKTLFHKIQCASLLPN